MVAEPSAEDRIAEEEKRRRRDSRKTGIALAAAALEQGAQSPNSTGNPLRACGLREVLDMVFGEEMDYVKRRE